MKKKSVSPFGATLLLFLVPFSLLMAQQRHGPSPEGLLRELTITSDLPQKATDSLRLWKEQVVLHLNKDAVMPRDILFFKAYMLTGPKHLRVSGSSVLKVELLDAEGNLIKSQNHTIKKGTSFGSFEVPRKISAGDYYVRAYTRWMLNYGPEHFAIKKIEIGSPKDWARNRPIEDGGIGIFPEGGNLVSGLNNRVAVRLNDYKQRDLQVVNGSDEVVAQIKSYGNGIGTFLIRPNVGEEYAIKLNEDQKVALPKTQETGYSIQMSNLDNKSMLARIEVSSKLRENALFITGNAGGVDYFKKKVEFKDKTRVEINIPRENMPEGIGYLQLEDEFGEVWARRPLYNERKKLQIQFEPVPNKEEQTILELKVTDNEGNPVETELSVALGMNKAFHREKEHLTPLDFNLRNQRYLNDLLLLTGQSSKLFVGNTTDLFPTDIKYNFQNGLDFYGQAYDLNKSLLTNTKIQVLIMTEDEAIVEEVETNSDGLFHLFDLSFHGEVKMAFRTTGEELRNQLVQVIPFVYETPPLFGLEEAVMVSETKVDEEARSKLRKSAADFISGSSKDDELIALDEVTLIEKKGYRKTSPSIYNLEPARVKYQDLDNPKTIPQLFLGIPGVYVSGMGDLNPEISLLQSSGVGPVLWVVDGLPLIQPTSLVQIINMVNYNDVERIEILTGPQASMYGSRAAGGAIIVYTRSGSDESYIARKEAQLSFEGYHKSLDFDAYRRAIPKRVSRSEGVPATVYWNPVVRTDKEGKATIQFETPKDQGSLFLEVQGITEDGKKGAVKTIWPL